MKHELQTVRGYKFSEVTSAMQKAIRRGDAKLAGYWAIELFMSGYASYAWRRLLTISAEDCWGILTQEVKALFESWQMIDRAKKGGGRVFMAKAVILLSQAKKSRDADHLTNLIYDAKDMLESVLDQEIEDARKHPEDIPDYAYDCHTAEGRRRGKTKADFFRDEQRALQPKQLGLFDNLAE